jgi:hypothetical protein
MIIAAQTLDSIAASSVTATDRQQNAGPLETAHGA